MRSFIALFYTPVDVIANHDRMSASSLWWFKELRFCSQTHSYSSPRSRVYQIAVEKQGGQTHSQLVSVHTPRLFFQYDSLYYMRDDVYMKRTS